MKVACIQKLGSGPWVKITLSKNCHIRIILTRVFQSFNKGLVPSLKLPHIFTNLANSLSTKKVLESLMIFNGTRCNGSCSFKMCLSECGTEIAGWKQWVLCFLCLREEQLKRHLVIFTTSDLVIFWKLRRYDVFLVFFRNGRGHGSSLFVG